MLTVGEQIGKRHFGARAIRRLAKQGIKVIGSTATPGPSGTYLDSHTAYELDDNGTHRIRSFLEVIALAEVK